ncbi:hypothetical protein [Nonomuraea sp. NPDC052265]|uniref:hypothetical protein n=1 Tax=Nonomuraea sp. NPDC052265 TaxID=3364374 RepID=UPI0037C5FCE7
MSDGRQTRHQFLEGGVDLLLGRLDDLARTGSAAVVAVPLPQPVPVARTGFRVAVWPFRRVLRLFAWIGRILSSLGDL